MRPAISDGAAALTGDEPSFSVSPTSVRLPPLTQNSRVVPPPLRIPFTLLWILTAMPLEMTISEVKRMTFEATSMTAASSMASFSSSKVAAVENEVGCGLGRAVGAGETEGSGDGDGVGIGEGTGERVGIAVVGLAVGAVGETVGVK